VFSSCPFEREKKSNLFVCCSLWLEPHPFTSPPPIHRILFRDLKPDNVAVNLRGDYLIFDFGLSKELLPKDCVEPPDIYQATGLTGSRRYMAPEVVWCKGYGFSADVYSYGILFWETFALEIPFDQMTVDQHFEQVVVKGKRPSIKKALLRPPKRHTPQQKTAAAAAAAATSTTTTSTDAFVLSKQLQVMLEQCWTETPSQRPKFKAICEQLKNALTNGTNALQTRDGLTHRTEHLLEKSHASRVESIKECC
jgi:serine/threonine protein kinase